MHALWSTCPSTAMSDTGAAAACACAARASAWSPRNSSGALSQLDNSRAVSQGGDMATLSQVASAEDAEAAPAPVRLHVRPAPAEEEDAPRAAAPSQTCSRSRRGRHGSADTAGQRSRQTGVGIRGRRFCLLIRRAGSRLSQVGLTPLRLARLLFALTFASTTNKQLPSPGTAQRWPGERRLPASAGALPGVSSRSADKLVEIDQLGLKSLRGEVDE